MFILKFRENPSTGSNVVRRKGTQTDGHDNAISLSPYKLKKVINMILKLCYGQNDSMYGGRDVQLCAAELFTQYLVHISIKNPHQRESRCNGPGFKSRPKVRLS
jgi:hypothetical protein